MRRFVQSYYTVSCEEPSSPTSFISWRTRFDDFKNYAEIADPPNPPNPPAYISSVTYGRELWMLIQSNSEESEVKQALKASYETVASRGEGHVTNEQREILNATSFQVLAVGGRNSSNVDIITGDIAGKLRDYLRDGANYSRTSPGQIISYTVRYLKNNHVARVSSSSDYTIQTSRLAGEAPSLRAIDVTWNTTNDGKDGDTQATAAIYDEVARRVGLLECCSAGGGDTWSRGAPSTRSVPIAVNGLTTDDFSHGRFAAGRNAQGRDDWDFTATMTLTFSNGETILKTCSGRNGCEVTW